jgi:hypothetical protein
LDRRRRWRALLYDTTTTKPECSFLCFAGLSSRCLRRLRRNGVKHARCSSRETKQQCCYPRLLQMQVCKLALVCLKRDRLEATIAAAAARTITNGAPSVSKQASKDKQAERQPVYINECAGKRQASEVGEIASRLKDTTCDVTMSSTLLDGRLRCYYRVATVLACCCSAFMGSLRWSLGHIPCHTHWAGMR